MTDWGRGGGWGFWKHWLFWPLDVPRLTLVMIGSPLHELAWELHSRVNLYGEILGAALLIWDFAQQRTRR